MKTEVTLPRRVYVAGPMSGMPAFNFPTFEGAAKVLRGYGFDVVSPAEINVGVTDWEACMRADLAQLVTCDAIALLPRFEQSEGAMLELNVARKVGLEIFRLDELVALAARWSIHE
jgi:nucleoside 2-deoxyribosyltransferase